jgi:hypothetical protein
MILFTSLDGRSPISTATPGLPFRAFRISGPPGPVPWKSLRHAAILCRTCRELHAIPPVPKQDAPRF